MTTYRFQMEDNDSINLEKNLQSCQFGIEEEQRMSIGRERKSFE